MMIDALPNIEENPASLPKAPDIPATSNKAAPIPTKPLPISGQFIPPNIENDDAKSVKLFITVDIPIAANIDENPAIFDKRPIMKDISPRATPIPIKPLVMLPQDNFPISDMAFAILDKDKVMISKANPLPTDFKPEILLNTFMVALNSINAPSIPIRPLIISPHFILPNLDRALANVLHTLAKTIIAKHVDIFILTPSKAFNERINSTKPIPIAVKPFPICPSERFDILTIADDNIFIALVIKIIDKPALIKPLLG